MWGHIHVPGGQGSSEGEGAAPTRGKQTSQTFLSDTCCSHWPDLQYGLLVEREPGKCVVSADLNIFRDSICKKIEGLDSVMQQAEFTLPDLTGFYVTPRSPISPPHDPSPCPRAPPGHHCLSQCDWHPQDTVSGSPPHFFSGQNQMAGGMVLSPGKVQGTLTPLFGRLSSLPEGLPVAQSLASLQM